MNKNIKQSVFYLIDIIGKPIACYQLESFDSFAKLYKNRLLLITDQGLANYSSHTNSKTNLNIPQKYRYVISANNQQHKLLLQMQPIKCYLRDQTMNAKIIKINPYNSVGWLKYTIQQQKNIKIKLIINQIELTQNNQCLLKYIYEDAIIHIIDININNKQNNLILYTKEPGADSKLFKIQGVCLENTVQSLVKQIEKLVGIPQEHLYLVYGGKILVRNKLINDYCIQNNGYVYAVDGRKYMKTITMQQYKKRLQQVKKVKQCNKQIIQMVQHAQQKNQTNANQNKNKQSQLKQNIGEITHKQHSKTKNNNNKNRYTYQKSGTIQIEADQDDIKYFKQQQQQMNIQSQQFGQFQKRGNQLQQSRRLQKQQQKQINKERYELQMRKGNSQLQKARMITNTTNVYEDQLGNIHQHNTQRSTFRNGFKTVDIDIMEDKQGNIIQIQHDIIKVKKDSITGQTLKVQTDIIQDNNNIKTTITKQQTRDRDGNIIRYQTSKYTQNIDNQFSPLTLQQQQQQQQQIVPQQKAQTSQQKLIQLDPQGNIHTHQSKIVQKQNKTIFIDKDIYQDQNGNILSTKTGVIQIQSDQSGNIYKHKSKIAEQGNNLHLQQTNQIINNQGILISKQKDIIQITQQQDGSILKKQIQILQKQNKKIITTRNVTQDSSGSIIKTSKKVLQIQDGQFQINIHQHQQIQQQIPIQQIQQQQQQSIPINIQKQIIIKQDQFGNKITTQRQYKQQDNGQSELYTKYTVENQDGVVLQEKTQKLAIVQEGDRQPEVLRYTTNYVNNNQKQQEENGDGGDFNRNIVQIQQNRSRQSLDGHIIQSINNKIQIEGYQDGMIRTCKTNIIKQQDGNRIIQIKSQLTDQQGKLITKTTDIIQLQAKKQSNTISIQNNNNQQQQPISNDNNNDNNNNVVNSVNNGIVTIVQKSHINKTYKVDQYGNMHVTQIQQYHDQGRDNITQKQQIYTKQGKILQKITDIKQTQQLTNGQTSYKISDIVQQGNITTVIQTNSIVDSNGKQIRKQTGTIQIQKIGDGLTRKQKQIVKQENGIRVKVHKQEYLDQDGNILEEQVTTTQLPNPSSQNNNDSGVLISQVYKRRIQQVQQDDKGNIHTHLRQIQQPQPNKSIKLQSQIIRTQTDQLLKATTDVIQQTQNQNGTITKHKVNIIEQPGKVTVIQGDYNDKNTGQIIQGQIKTVVLKEGQDQETFIKKQTDVIIQDKQKIVVEKITVQDKDGHKINMKGKAKIVYVDQNGVQQSRELEKYQIGESQLHKQQQKQQQQQKEQQNEQQQKEQQQQQNINTNTNTNENIITQISQDINGNIHTSKSKIIQNQDQGTTIIQTQLIQNKQGQLIGINTKTIQTQQLSQSNQNIKKQQSQYLTQDKLIKTKITTISNSDGNIQSQQQNRIEIDQNLGLIKTSTYDIVKKDGQTTVGLVQKYQDKQGNILNENKNTMKIRNSQQAMNQYAIKVAQAQLFGSLKNKQSYTQIDEDGNKKIIAQQQIINKNGQTITVRTTTILSLLGQLIKAQTEIIEQKKQNGQIIRYDTQIIQKQGKVQVIQYNNVEKLEDKGRLAFSRQGQQQQNLDDLLGINQQATLQKPKLDFKFTNSIQNSTQLRKIQQLNSNQNSTTKQQQQKQQTNLLDQDYIQAQQQQFMISALDKQRNQTQIKVRYDQSMNQVTNKLKQQIGKQSSQIHFYKDGKQLNQNQSLSDLEISNGDILYYVQDNQHVE